MRIRHWQTRVADSMTANQLDTIARVLMEFEKSNRVPCTGCGYCMPCPKGINIPGCFAPTTRAMRKLVYGAVAILYGECGAHEQPKLVSNCVKCGKCAATAPAHRYSRASRRCAPTFPAWSRDGGA
ncbi:MAG: 4Fe-4S dicluster domain-containing protein [Collinsella sp.]